MIVIIDYGMGNLNSVLKAFKRVGAEVLISSRIEDINRASKLVLPGVGHFKKGMEKLEKMNLIELINKKVLEEKIPILGICLGMQLITRKSEEGNVNGFGWINAETVKFNVDTKVKIPHMGWNTLKFNNKGKLLKGISEEDYFYFVHSFHVISKDAEAISAKSFYGENFVSVIEKNNVFGTQFHPETSHEEGLKIIKNFAELEKV